MTVQGITPLRIKNEKPRTVRAEIADGRCRGLYLVPHVIETDAVF